MEKQPWRERQISWLSIVGLIVLGCILRLIWAEDMKWKLDEIWMFETARAVVTGHQSFPLLGMRSSAGILNPGASVWCFILLGFVSPDPVSMVRWVAILNIVGIASFFWFFSTRISQNQRLIWLWGLAIASVNPLAIVFSRKIWTCNILAPFCFLIFLGHWYRVLKWGAFLWGFVGTFVGQIHMSGFFFQAGLLLWTIGHDYRQKTLRKTAWTAWLLGTSIGAIFLIPWIRYLLFEVGQSISKSVGRLLTPEFYVQWLTLGWGLNLEHDMGKVFWQRFLAEPRFFGYPSYGMAIAHLFLAFCALSALLVWLMRQFRGRSKEQFPELTFYIGAGAIAMGALMIVSGLRVPVYYLNILFPFVQIWVAFLYRSKPRDVQAAEIAQNTWVLRLEINALNELPDRWAKSTETAIQSGILHTVIAGIEAFIQDWQQRFAETSIVLTGGDAALIHRLLDSKISAQIQLDQNVAFWGIRSIRNQFLTL